MPTESDTGPAAAAASSEARRWADAARSWSSAGRAEVWADTPPAEGAVLPEYGNREGLREKATWWGYELRAADLSDLSTFAAALAQTEAIAWADGDASTATRAHMDRRFLVGDRIVPWAVPWLDTVGRCYPAERDEAHRTRDEILRIADHLRTEPEFVEGEGMTLEGHDGYGPRLGGGLRDRVSSLMGGTVVLRRTAESVTGRRFSSREAAIGALVEQHLHLLPDLYRAAATRWRRFAGLHPGSARNWLDLALRADDTVLRIVDETEKL